MKIIAVMGALLALGLVGFALLAATWGGLGCRSVAELKGSKPLPEGIRRVRIEAPMGSFLLKAGSQRELQYEVTCRRAADTAEQLADLERVSVDLSGTVDLARPDVLLVKAPEIPESVDRLHCILAVEVNVTLPADLALEVEISGSGHLTVVGRQAEVLMTTRHGDLDLSFCRGDAVLKTGAGTILVVDHEGNLEVNAKTGAITARVRSPGADLLLVTGSGNIQCEIPASTGFQLDGRTEQGHAVARQFGIRDERVLEYGGVMVGTRGDGHTKIVMRTGVGHLSLAAHDFR